MPDQCPFSRAALVSLGSSCRPAQGQAIGEFHRIRINRALRSRCLAQRGALMNVCRRLGYGQLPRAARRRLNLDSARAPPFEPARRPYTDLERSRSGLLPHPPKMNGSKGHCPWRSSRRLCSGSSTFLAVGGVLLAAGSRVGSLTGAPSGHAMLARVYHPVQGRFAPAEPVAFGDPSAGQPTLAERVHGRDGETAVATEPGNPGEAHDFPAARGRRSPGRGEAGSRCEMHHLMPLLSS